MPHFPLDGKARHFVLLSINEIKIGCTATVFSMSGNERQVTAVFKVGEGALDGAAGEAEVCGDAVDAGPALALVIGAVTQVHINHTGAVREIPVGIDAAE